MPQSQNALSAVSAAAHSQNPPRLSILSYKYSSARPMSSVKSTLKLCDRNSVYGTCETRANTNRREAYRLIFEVWLYPSTSKNAMMGKVRPPKPNSTHSASVGRYG